MTTFSLRMARPDSDDLKHMRRLFRAAQLADFATRRQRAWDINFDPDWDEEKLTREEKFFFRCAWRACIDTGAFDRLFGSYDTLFHNFGDPEKDYIDIKPELRAELERAELVDVFSDAYAEACAGVTGSEKQKRELVMLVKSLAHSLRHANPASKQPDRAMEYLSQSGLISVEDVLR
jgi:hypothetical protein